MIKTEVTGYYIKVNTPKWRYLNDPIAAQKDVCEKMADQIRRHVDDVDSVEIIEETEDVCEYCGRTWTEPQDNYNDGCCSRDKEDNIQPREER